MGSPLVHQPFPKCEPKPSLMTDGEGEVIRSDAISRWGEVPPPEEDGLAEALLDDTVATPYPVNEEFNFKIALWQVGRTASHTATRRTALG